MEEKSNKKGNKQYPDIGELKDILEKELLIVDNSITRWATIGGVLLIVVGAALIEVFFEVTEDILLRGISLGIFGILIYYFYLKEGREAFEKRNRLNMLRKSIYSKEGISHNKLWELFININKKKSVYDNEFSIHSYEMALEDIDQKIKNLPPYKEQKTKLKKLKKEHKKKWEEYQKLLKEQKL